MTERHFRVVQLANKKVEIGGVSITSKASPGSAARKLLTSIAHEKGLKKNKKVNMGKVTFSIQEYTQGSSKKVYGPYVGHFHKYTAAELKKAKTAGGKVKFTMKPVVKLAKKNMKGGIKCETNREKYLAYDINVSNINKRITQYGNQYLEIAKYNNEYYDPDENNSENYYPKAKPDFPINSYIACITKQDGSIYVIPNDCYQTAIGLYSLHINDLQMGRQIFSKKIQ